MVTTSPSTSWRAAALTSRGRHRSFDSGEVTDVGTEGSVGADVVAFVLDDVVVVVQPQSAQIVNLLLAKVAGAAGEVGCS